jgi:hypothetical protein
MIGATRPLNSFRYAIRLNGSQLPFHVPLVGGNDK